MAEKDAEGSEGSLNDSSSLGLEPVEIQAETITLADAAARLGIGMKAAKRAVLAGEIPAIRVGRRWLVLRAPLDAMLKPVPMVRAKEEKVD